MRAKFLRLIRFAYIGEGLAENIFALCGILRWASSTKETGKIKSYNFRRPCKKIQVFMIARQNAKSTLMRLIEALEPFRCCHGRLCLFISPSRITCQINRPINEQALIRHTHTRTLSVKMKKTINLFSHPSGNQVQKKS